MHQYNSILPTSDDAAEEQAAQQARTSRRTMYGLTFVLVVVVFTGVLLYNAMTESPSRVASPANDLARAPSPKTVPAPAAAPAASPAASAVSTNLIDDHGRFVLRNFDTAKSFSSFLPGVAGLDGKPLWAFYVNRGQAIAGFGIKVKDEPIMEFKTANRAYESVPLHGFRTFLELSRSGNHAIYEPFLGEAAANVQRTMMIGMNELQLQEQNSDLGIQTDVLYFTLPEEPFPALIRRLNVTNTGKTPLSLGALDGLAKIEPYGINDWFLNHMGRTVQAWYNVFNLDRDEATLPFFRVSATVADSEVVFPVTAGNWALSFVETADGKVARRLPFVVDPEYVFGADESQVNPAGLRQTPAPTIPNLLKRLDAQITTTRTASAFSLLDETVLQPGQTITITSVYGRAPDIATLRTNIAPKVTTDGFVRAKRQRATSILRSMTDVSKTVSGSRLFDEYVAVNYLDNTLRGGFPVMLGTGNDKKTYYAFSRIHGDLERDYNYFVLEPEYFSFGPGNFRDVNQNRRSNLLFEPRIGTADALLFWSLMQADAYNPLSIRSQYFELTEAQADALARRVTSNERDWSVLRGLLLPGQQIVPFELFRNIETNKIQLKVTPKEFMDFLADEGIERQGAEFGDGFWADHFTYSLDIIQTYLKLYPDQSSRLLMDTATPFFQSPNGVQPRYRKYILLRDFDGTLKPRQIGAQQFDGDKNGFIEGQGARDPATKKLQRDKSGKVFTASLNTKLMMMIVIKFATMDPAGMGVEMEAGKPGWLDALNGLPALFGSGMPETFEVQRMVQFLRNVLADPSFASRPLPVPVEVMRLWSSTEAALVRWRNDRDDFAYWQAVANAREMYRDSVRLTFDGELRNLNSQEVIAILNQIEDKIKIGVEKALAMNDGLTPTYFYFEPTSYEQTGGTDNRGNALIKVNGFRPVVLPAFLEGVVRHLKVLPDVPSRRALYQQARNSPLYDRKLGMYRICAPLAQAPNEIGRVRAFAPGWLERESVWTHMSYKFYLELLRGGLYEEFWTEAKTGLVVFMDPAVYGRSTLEASSFIASSAFPDAKLHGTGFYSRLSGATAEFISMWLEMMAGSSPFVAAGNDVALSLKPALPGWLFTNEGLLSFRFINTVNITYVNPRRVDTWTTEIKKIRVLFADASVAPVDVNGAVLNAPYGAQVRDGLVSALEVHL